MRSDWRGRRADGLCCFVLDPVQIDYRAQQFAAMAERRNADLFEVLICQISKNGNIDVVLDKPLSVLPETEVLKPVRTSPLGPSDPAGFLSSL